MTQFRLPDVRVVLDTQVILRGAVAANKSLTAKIYEVWIDSRFELLFSEATLNEIERVLQRPEVLRKLQFTATEGRALVLFIRRRGQLVEPVVRIQVSRDPDDDKFLECAVAGQATCFVTADHDLLSLRNIEGIPIMDIPTFWTTLSARLREAPAPE
jgi:putative PIN family toxin of toxin-antitoxin system